MTAVFLIAAIVNCYVGCNVGSPDRQSLKVLACDTETGAAQVVQVVQGCEGTTYLQLDASGRQLYSIVGERRDGKPVGSLVRFPVDGGRIGTMERLVQLPCEAPCHVSLTPDGMRIVGAAYSSAMVASAALDGSDLRTFVLPDDAMGPNARRQKKAHAHQCFYLPDGTLGVVDLGCDRIRFLNPETLRPAGMPDLKLDAGDGPRHAIFSKGGDFLFVVNELGNSVASFAFDGKSFRRIGKWSTLPSGGETDGLPLLKGEISCSKAAAIKLTADGKLLMASNRGYDSIAFYAVAGDGRLSLRNVAKLTGRFPRDFELMPGEKFMVVGHKMSNEIQVYRFDRAACTLTPVGAPIPCWRPLCFRFQPDA